MKSFSRSIVLAALVLGFALPARAQEHAEPAAPAPAAAAHSSREIDIQHHLANSRTLEYPCFKVPYACEMELPHWEPVHVGSLAIDLSPTKHSVYVLFAGLLVIAVLLYTSSAVKRAQAKGDVPRGFAGMMEATTLFVRNEIILPNVGHHGEGFVPFLMTVFFFILTCNLLGLLPWGSTATSNISVTAALAVMAFFVIEIAGMRALGFKGYMGTIFYLPHGLPTPLKPVLLLIMTPIEIIGKLAKPFALAVRLFANMTAGHVVVLALLGLTFFFANFWVGVAASAMSTMIMLLELGVAFLQAGVFTLLTSVFIGLMRAEH